ncbi:MAG: acyl-CoA dehydratase activase [Bacillota bacterium]
MICGIDLGSRDVKMVLMENRQVVETRRFDTMGFYRRLGRCREGQLVIPFGELGLPPIDLVISTGYGRNTLAVEGGRVIPELQAHLLGAVFQTGLADFTLLDLGGQDSKVILVRGGRMADFYTNDRCAASSGRYLENMAAVLGMDLTELSSHFEDPVDLDATCAIFGESELIGKVLEGYPLKQLAAGVNYSVVKRVKPMLKNLQSTILVFCGGVANNQGIQRLLEKELGAEVVIPPEPQLNGAIGCCVFAASSQ